MSLNGSVGQVPARRPGARSGVAARLALAASLAAAVSASPVVVGGSAAATGQSATASAPVETDLLQAYTRAKLTDPRPEGDSNFGSAVAVDGDTAVIGAPMASPHGPGSGIAYVVVRTANGEWAEQARLTQSDADRADYFGGSVAIDGDTIIVGAEDVDSKGRAYVFVRSGSTWTQQAKLEATHPPGGRASQFGAAVALDGDLAVIGDPGEYVPEVGEWTGAAHVFGRSGGVWTHQARFIDPTGWDGGDGGSGMAESVAIDDGTVVVGEPYAADGDRIFTGRALVYSQTASGWKRDAILTNPEVTPVSFFGWAVDIEGGTLVVGQNGDLPGFQGGSVYVFERDGATWAVQARLRARDSATGDGLGGAVSVHGDMVAAGAPTDGSERRGAAYVFLRAGDTWTQRVKLAPGPLDSVAQLGTAVAIGADHLLFGAPYQSTGKGEQSGVVWAYSGLAG